MTNEELEKYFTDKLNERIDQAIEVKVEQLKKGLEGHETKFDRKLMDDLSLEMFLLR